MVALDKQFDHHRGTKPPSRGRWRDESWQAGKFPDHRTADILSARRPRDTSNSSNTSCANFNHRKASFTGVVSSCGRGENRFYIPGSQLSSSDLPVDYLQDANWNTTAVVGFNGTTGTWGVTQRYVYSPYGNITVLNAEWSTPPAGTQPIVNNLYQGMTMDVVTGLYDERFRNYSPSLGTWISQDPLSYVNGANTYQFEVSQPATSADPTGEVQWSVLLDGVEHLAFGAVMFGLSYGAVASGVGVAAFPGLFLLGGYEGVTGLVQIAAAFGPAQIASDASKLPGTPGDIVALNAKALGASDTQSKVIGDAVDFGATGGFGSAGEDIAKTATGYLLAKTAIEAKDYKTWTGNAIASVGAILPKVTSTATPNMVARLEIKGIARVTLKSRPRFVGHIVTKGENLWAIWHHAGGNSTGVTWSQMKQANSFLKNPAALQPGWGVLAPSPCDRGGRLTTILVDLSGAEKC